MSTKPELVSNGNHPGKIKKKKKARGTDELNMSASQMSVNQLNGEVEESTKTVPIDRRTLSNGLTIEELESGPPGGKVAVQGKKVSFFVGLVKKLLIMAAAFMFDLICLFFILSSTVDQRNIQIKLFYTGMLKESGKVFDSNVGKSAFKFQLGNNS